MKRFTSIAFLFLMGLMTSPMIMASRFFNVNPYIQLEVDRGMYKIHYSFDGRQFNIVTDEFGDNPQDLCLTNRIELEYDVADYLDFPGKPALPFFTLILPVPNSIAYSDIQSVSSCVTSTFNLEHRYTPSQNGLDNVGMIYFDEDYYSGDSAWLTMDYTLSEPFEYNGIQAVAANIYPFHYSPDHHSLIVNREGMVEFNMFPVDIEEIINNLHQEWEWDWGRFWIDVPNEAPVNYYLIVSSKNLLNTSEMEQFIDYKSRLGLSIITDSIPSLCNYNDVRNLINAHNMHNRLKYVLLVGDSHIIPYYGDNNNDRANPISDYLYACTFDPSRPNRYDLEPDIYVGRWPVSSREELGYIVNKTIATECALESNVHTNIILASDGKRAFKKSNNWIKENIDAPSGSPSYNYTLMTDQNDFYDLKHELESSPWLFLYRGRCENQGLANFYGSTFSINTISTSNNLFYPIGLGFGDSICNYYHDGSFGEKWVTSTEGGAAFWGPTTETYSETETNLIKRLFTLLPQFGRYVALGEWVYMASTEYYKANQVEWRERQIKKMVLFGDPSLRIHGRGSSYCDNIEAPQNLIGRPIQEELSHNEKEDGELIIYTIDGKRLGEYPTRTIAAQNLPNGTFFVLTSNSRNHQLLIVNH